MSLLISTFVFLSFIVSGAFTSKHIFRDEEPVVIILFSLVFGLAYMMWLPALTSFVLGFTVLSQLLGIALAIIVGIVFYGLSRDIPFKQFSFKNERPLLFTIVPIFIFTCYLLYTHVLYPGSNGSLWGGQSTFGDLNMHLGFITSITRQKIFPPYYSLIAEKVKIGYPFLCDSISSTFYTLGVTLRLSYALPMVVAMFTVFLGTYLFFRQWLKENSKSVLATILFLIGGGFGFAYFFDIAKKEPGKLQGILKNFYTTPTNFVDKNVKWVNVIADIFIPQRATLFGFAILFPCLILLYMAAFEDKKKYFIPLGFLAGTLPLIHAHSFLALGILSTVYLVYAFLNAPDNQNVFVYLKDWFLYAAIALLLASPQLIMFTFNQAIAGSFIKFHFNWANDMDSYLWFYIKNLGLIYILILPAFISIGKASKWFYSGSLMILFICECIVFQPNTYDNNKLLFVWYLFSCGLVSDFLVNTYKAMENIKGRTVLAFLLIFTLNISGVLTLWRETVSKFELYNSHGVEASKYIMENTAPDSLFLTSDNHNNIVASLTGRNIYCGSGSFLFFHGINYVRYLQQEKEMFKNPTMEDLIANKINYVYLSDYEENLDVDYDFFKNNLELCYANERVKIYKVQ